MKLPAKSRFDVYSLTRPIVKARAARTSVARLSRLARAYPEQLKESAIPAPGIVKFGPAPLGEFSPVEFGHYAEKRLLWFLHEPPALGTIELKSDTRIHTPTYDLGWQEGVALATRFDGSAFVIGDDGFGAGGFGITLRSPQRVFVTVTPHGGYRYSWASFSDNPRLASAGGLGTVVYRGSQIEPGTHRNAVLWNLRGAAAFTGDTGGGAFTDAVVGGPTFPQPTFRHALVPVRFTMEANTTYQFWIWGWQRNTAIRNTPFLAFLNLKVPAISVTMEPPYFPPLH